MPKQASDLEGILNLGLANTTDISVIIFAMVSLLKSQKPCVNITFFANIWNNVRNSQ